MSLARLVVAAVRIEVRSKSEVARNYRVSRQWVHELVRCYDAKGEAGLEPRSCRPLRSPHRTPVEVEDEIVELRKALLDQGLDAGAHTVAFHLNEQHGTCHSGGRSEILKLAGDSFKAALNADIIRPDSKAAEEDQR